jgi:VIT1/CCC1 family predicted Fe2+/Mn2+ transporter
MKTFLSDRLNVAWLVSGLVLVAVLVFVPNEGAGTFVLIAVAAVAIGLSGAARIRDGRRDRARRASQPRRRGWRRP